MAEITLPENWPPAPEATADHPESWLRYEREYPGSNRISRLIAHPTVPFVAGVSSGDVPLDLADFSTVAEAYLNKLANYVNGDTRPLGQADPVLNWLRAVADVEASAVLQWCPIWPAIDGSGAGLQGPIASWNLSPRPDAALPATVVLVAAEALPLGAVPGAVARLRGAGFRVPIEVRRTAEAYELILRGLTAEFPGGTHQSLSEALAGASARNRETVLENLGQILPGAPFGLAAADDPNRGQASRVSTLERIAEKSGTTARSLLLQDLRVAGSVDDLVAGRGRLRVQLLGRGSAGGASSADGLSYRVDARLTLRDKQADVAAVQRQPLVTHAVAGNEGIAQGQPHPAVGQDQPRIPPIEIPLRVFPVPPPDWQGDGGIPRPPLAWRRPSRIDPILDGFRDDVAFSLGGGLELARPAFVVRNCPRFVPGDGPANLAKVLPHGPLEHLPPRRDVSTAISAYWHCQQMFALMESAGLHPDHYVATAEGPLSVHYRSGITPGPGRSGRTINAQVRYEVAEDAASQPRPAIDMHLALATLNRWSRPTPPSHGRNLSARPAQPLGFASSGRWMMHEFAHYLLAARIGQLEFDFAHSPGDGMAAVYFDPLSQLAEPDYPGNPQMRGWTYPFVFAPRRHDRSPLRGWGWYGLMNRAVVEDPPSGGDIHKGYLSEQILSSSLFLLYRCLGGDSVQDGRAAQAQRLRASDGALYLLLQAIAALAQPPSRAEMLEVGMEAAAWLASSPVVLQRGGGEWQPATSHKVVRWAFEQMGMFPLDPTKVCRSAGAPPLIDLYIRDRRPLRFPTAVGDMPVGPGSYVPVSLTWEEAGAWMMPGPLPLIGNRGRVTAEDVMLRGWVGIELAGHVSWPLPVLALPVGAVISSAVQDLAVGAALASAVNEQVALAQANANAGSSILLLYELTAPGDRANTDPAAALACAVDDTADLPVTQQALIDLVAGDNNLGLYRFAS